MQQEIGSELDRVVPAEILEVDEGEFPVLSAHGVVKAEIGGDKA